MATDYRDGEAPVPVGSLVDYKGGRYSVVEHRSPGNHPNPPKEPPLTVAYPDGTAYFLWPVGVPQKMGNSYLSRVFVRRTSFEVVERRG